MSKYWQIGRYIVSDFLTSAIAWFIFNVCRYYDLVTYQTTSSLGEFLSYSQVLAGQVCIPFFWLAVYAFSGYYNWPLERNRLSELWQTLVSSFVGVLFVFFVLVLDEIPRSYEIYYYFLFELFGLHFGLTYLARLWLTSRYLKELKGGKYARKVLLIGTGSKALQIAGQLEQIGYHVSGFVQAAPAEVVEADSGKVWGDASDLPRLLRLHPVDELVVATEALDGVGLSRFLYTLYRYKMPIKVWMDKQTIPFSKIRLRTISGVPLADITENNFSPAGKNLKWVADKLLSACALVLLSPLYLYIAWRVRRDSPGPVIYKQERIGYRGCPFMIYKFRTMYVSSEKNGPMLAREDDKRITPFGSVLRKYRLDELPQFWNVLKGDMSLVGPRPERKYFIDKIVQQAPYYYLLHNVKPGITSLGMVKYGYAGSVEQMLERLDYDIIYYENMSLALDIAILAYTVKTVLTGKGV